VAAIGAFVWWRARPQTDRPEQPRWEPAWLTRLAGWEPACPDTPGKRALAWIWASPMTALGLLAAATTGRPLHRSEDGLLVTNATGPVAAELRRRGFKATTLGHVIIAVSEPSEALLAHERLHTRQAERLGPLFGPVYVLLLLVYGYRSHPMERAARLAGRRVVAGDR
jgi:hypothetical protein